jgi:hypothetical protein
LLFQATPPNKKARSNFIGLVHQSDQNNFPENLLSIESGREFTTVSKLSSHQYNGSLAPLTFAASSENR